MFTNLGRGRWDSIAGEGRTGGSMDVEEGAIEQLPFHESIVILMEVLNRISVVEFAIICRMISFTKIPKDHEEILDALDHLAQRSGIELWDVPGYYAEAIQALHEGMFEAGDDLWATDDHHEGMVETEDDFDTTVDPILDEDDSRGND